MRHSRFAIVGVLLAFLSPDLFTVREATGTKGLLEAGQRTKKVRSKPRPPKIDYSRFSHSTAPHKQTCDSCHKFPSKNWESVRSGGDAFADVTEFPEHSACLSCHRQQFFARERPAPRICINCHVKATPVDTSRYTFPSLGENFLNSPRATGFVSDFRVAFPHDKHLDVISLGPNQRQDNPVKFVRASFGLMSEDSDPKSCATCHQTYQPQGKSDEEFVTKPPADLGDKFWLKKGTFKTRPVTHASCFTCHNKESELAPLPSDCNACHKLPPPPGSSDFDGQLAGRIKTTDWWTTMAWRNRVSAGAFRHEVHVDLSCTKCHNPAAMNTVDLKTLKVSVLSCGGGEGCHVTATVDDGGILNYEIDKRKTDNNFLCSKCHLSFGSHPLPASHIEAVRKAAAK